MSESIQLNTHALLLSGVCAVSPCIDLSSGVSECSESLKTVISDYGNYYERSEALFGKRAAVINDLESFGLECSEEDWDGEGSSPVSLAALEHAKAIIRKLPEHLPMPEVCVDSDGDVSLEWLPNILQTFTLSVNSSGGVSYAWVDGVDRGYAKSKVIDGILSSVVIGVIERTTGSRYIAIGAAS